MRILLITHFFPPQHNAGTENYTLGLARMFAQRGHDVCVLCAGGWETGDSYWNGVSEDLYKGIRVRRVHLNWLKARDPNRVLYDSVPAAAWLDDFLAHNSFDIVHVTSTHSLGVGILRSVKRSGTPLVLTLMDFWFICPNAQLIRSDGSLCDGRTTADQCRSCLMATSNLFQRVRRTPLPDSAQALIWRTAAHVPTVAKQRGMRGMLLNMEDRRARVLEALMLPDLILTHSHIVQEMLSRNHAASVRVLPHGMDLSWRHAFPGRTPASDLRFGYIGQIQNSKGIHVLIEAFQRAQFDGLASLQIWGDLSRNPEYVRLLQSQKGDNPAIKMMGRFEQDRIGAVLAGIDVLIVPSIWYENSPLVIKEAFAIHTPVIASNIGGMAELVTHNVDGLLFKQADSADLARQMWRVVEHPELLESLRNSIRPVKPIDKEVQELEAIYRELIINTAADQ